MYDTAGCSVSARAPNRLHLGAHARAHARAHVRIAASPSLSRRVSCVAMTLVSRAPQDSCIITNGSLFPGMLCPDGWHAVTSWNATEAGGGTTGNFYANCVR